MKPRQHNALIIILPCVRIEHHDDTGQIDGDVITWTELKEALIEAVLPATLAEMLLVNIIMWCLILLGVGVGGA